MIATPPLLLQIIGLFRSLRFIGGGEKAFMFHSP